MAKDTRTIRGEQHALVLLKVITRDQFGRPKQVTVLYDENVENVKGGEEYITAYVHEKSVSKVRVN